MSPFKPPSALLQHDKVTAPWSAGATKKVPLIESGKHNKKNTHNKKPKKKTRDERRERDERETRERREKRKRGVVYFCVVQKVATVPLRGGLTICASPLAFAAIVGEHNRVEAWGEAGDIMFNNNKNNNKNNNNNNNNKST